MRIAFSGTLCTGKTTLIKELAKQPEFKNYKIIPEPIRLLDPAKYKLNEHADDNTQIKIQQIYLDNLRYNNTLMDRCGLDGFCYAEYAYKHNKLSKQTLDFCQKLYNLTKDNYDIIFYIRSEFALVNDGFRTFDDAIRYELQDIFDNNIKSNNKVVIIGGSVSERVKRVMSVFKDKTR